MAEAAHSFFTFNRGLVSQHALGRMDLKRMALSADTCVNWMPRTLGSMGVRPGTKYLQPTYGNAYAVSIPVTYAAGDTAIYELTQYDMRVVVDDTVVVRPAVSTMVTNGDFEQYSTPCTFQNAGDTVTYTGADVFANGDPVTFTGSVASPLSEDTTYYVRDLVAGSNTFKVAATAGGAAIVLTSDGSGTAYHGTYVSGWTDSDESGAVSTYAYVPGYGCLSLTGTGVNSAIRDQTVTVALADRGVEHALRIHVVRGTAVLQVGSTSGGSEYSGSIVLRPGYHSIGFTPTGDFYLRLKASDKFSALIDYIKVEASGEVVIPTPWPQTSLDDLRWEQSIDVTFVACRGLRHYRIERQDPRSWSVVEEPMTDGPFLEPNGTPITLAPAALSGSTTLTASANVFSSKHVGSLVRVSSNGQKVEATITGEDQFTDPIRVVGIDAGRSFTIDRSGTWVATVTLQRSVGAPGDWTDVRSYTTTGTVAYDDTLDNQIIYYRIGVKVGDYTSGTIAVSLRYGAGSIEGTALITGYTSPTTVSCDVLVPFGQVTASDLWWLGIWSDDNGWPTEVRLFEGRLWWMGRGVLCGSASDAYATFDDSIEGDSAPIKRGLGSGPNDVVNWALALDNLMFSTASEERVARASSLDEPLTNTACSLKRVASLGSASVAAVAVDTNGVFVQRGGSRVYEVSKENGVTYSANDLTAIIPEIGASPFTKVVVQRQPDTRIHCVREDGTVAILVFDKVEKVTCWVEWETDGVVEDAYIIPGAPEDAVYYTVRRTVDGATVRHRERWAEWGDTTGGSTTILADDCLVYSGASTATVTGLDHLEGEEVVVWGNSKDLGSYTVSAGSITLAEPCTLAVVGKPYPQVRWRSAKLALLRAGGELELNGRTQVVGARLLLKDTHAQGLRVGQDFDHMDALPPLERGAAVDPDRIWDEYYEDGVSVNGTWSSDTRLCLEGVSPRPCTVLAVQPIVSR